MKNLVPMMLCAALIHATPLVARAEPGQAFGGDDAGCVPDTKDHLHCGDAIAKAIAKLVGGVLKCHVQQANTRFKSAQSGGASAEEECEDGGSAKSAQGRFEAVLAKLDSSSLCAGTSTTAVARDYATALVAELDGPRNGAVYCDGTLPIDPTGDDAGTIDPTSTEHLRCADAVAKNLAKLFGAVVKCHVKTADQGFKGKSFDEESCEQDPPGVTGKGARGKYGAAVAKLVTGETCPPCLDANTQNGLGDDVVAELDRDNDRLYPCGGISTTTVVTTTSTTTTTLAPCTPIGGTARTFSISFMPPAGVDVAGVTVLVDYPEGQVSIPGSGNAASVKSSISNLPQGAFSSPNDLDYALREAVASSSALTPGRLFTITFQDCQGAIAPTAADFTCTVEDASDPSGNPVSGVTCTVSAP